MSWIEQSRAYLSAEVERVKRRLTGEPVNGATPHEETPPALVLLQRMFALSAFERDVIVWCAGAALDPAVPVPTFARALATLAEPHIDATTADAPLRSRRLLRLASIGAPLTAPLQIDERILYFVLGIDTLDEQLLPLRIVTPRVRRLTGPLVDELAAILADGSVAVQLSGGSAETRVATLCAAADRADLRPLRLRANDLPNLSTDQDVLATLCEREYLLGRALPTIEVDPLDSADTARTVRAFAQRIRCAVVIVSDAPVAVSRPAINIEIPWPSSRERREIWVEALGADAERVGPTLDRIAEQFRFDRPSIEAALAGCDRTADDASLQAAVWSACVTRSRAHIEDLALRIAPRATWDDLVLPDDIMTTLREIGQHLRQRSTVNEAWGFAREGRGHALTALFAGPSGTGKTLAAEVIARDAGLDLYHVDLSQVVDKYVGETEKRLRRIFDAAEHGGAILLFDEVDALFGKRGAIERGTDRWANLEVSYLLQRMERYRGLAILTTNTKDAIDPAFLRRLRFAVWFKFPDFALRAALWRRAFPPQTPMSRIDVELLARLQLTGANIKTVALASAVHAASERCPVSMAHIVRAARSEFIKLEVPFPEAELQTRLSSTMGPGVPTG